MISNRYLPATATLLAFALVPTVLHTYVGITESDGKTTGAISRSLADQTGVDTGRSAVWVQENFEATDFIERRYPGEVTLFVARSYDPKRLYHHPELGAAYGRGYDSTDVVRIPKPSGAVPVHVLTGQGGLACYVLLYDGEFVENPWSFQARQVISMLASPRRQMTLFFAHGPAASDATKSPVARIVVAAVDSFLAQTSTNAR